MISRQCYFRGIDFGGDVVIGQPNSCTNILEEDPAFDEQYPSEVMFEWLDDTICRCSDNLCNNNVITVGKIIFNNENIIHVL